MSSTSSPPPPTTTPHPPCWPPGSTGTGPSRTGCTGSATSPSTKTAPRSAPPPPPSCAWPPGQHRRRPTPPRPQPRTSHHMRPDLLTRDLSGALAYVATVIDLHSRALIGWAAADHMKTCLLTDALDMAITHRRPPTGVIFHSDRGTQYTSREFDMYCKDNNIRRSLGRTL